MGFEAKAGEVVNVPSLPAAPTSVTLTVPRGRIGSSVRRDYAKLRPRGYRMRYGSRNGIVARIAFVKSGEVKPHAKFEVEGSVEMDRVVSPGSIGDMDLSEGDQIRLVIQAIHALPAKEQEYAPD